VWSRAGDEIFFLCGDKLMAVPLRASADSLVMGTPKVLFENHRIVAYDASPDGRRFLVAEDPTRAAEPRLDVVVNWFGEVERKATEGHTP
jgi:hypothetical protein